MKARQLLLKRILATDASGRLTHFMKTRETEDVYMCLAKRILDFRPLKLELFTLASRVLLFEHFLGCSPNWIHDFVMQT